MSNQGKSVRVHYVGTFDDGTKFDSSRDRNRPLQFTCGAGQMIPGFDKAVMDMEVGEIKKVRLEPEEAYGPRREGNILTLAIDRIPGAENLKVGDRVNLTAPDGLQMQVTVCEKSVGNISFDANHEMAGKYLNFEIELLEIVEK